MTKKTSQKKKNLRRDKIHRKRGTDRLDDRTNLRDTGKGVVKVFSFYVPRGFLIS